MSLYIREGYEREIWEYREVEERQQAEVVVPQPAIQHAFPPVSAAVGKQAALTQPSPHALHLWPASNWAFRGLKKII